MNTAVASYEDLPVQERRAEGVPLRRWLAVLAALLGAFMAVLDIQISNASLQDITGGIGATLDEGSWISLAYLVPEIVVIPLCGWLASVFGQRRYLIWNSVLFLAFSLCCGRAWNLESMVIFRALQGFTGGALIPMAATMVLTMLPASRQPLGFALFGLSAMFAPAIGPSVGGWITENFGWPWIYYLNLLPGVLFVAGIAHGLDPEPPRLSLLRKADWAGIALMAAGLGSLTVFLEEGTRKDWFGSVMITRLAIVAAIALPCFVLLELLRRKTEPVLNLRLFRDWNFALGSTANLVLGVALYGSMYLLPLYLAQIQGYGALQIGRTMMWVGLPQLVTMPLVPVLMKFVDRRALAAAGFAAFGISCLLMSRLTQDFAHDQLVAPQIIRAAGLSFIIVPLSLITTGNIAPKNAAAASGLFNMLRNLGGSIGIALLSALITQREHFHSHHLGEAISLYDPQTRARLAALAGAYASRGLSGVGAHDRAVALLDAGVRQQAYLLAFNDAFHVLAILLLAMIPLLLLSRKTKAASAAGVH
jgi:DHA2 family multidrug resistance protein